jgi:hypothetical protein
MCHKKRFELLSNSINRNPPPAGLQRIFAHANTLFERADAINREVEAAGQ